MRTTKKERKNNAKQFYAAFMNGCSTKAAIVVKRYDSTTNPNVNRVQFLAVPSGLAYGNPVVIAESNALGIEGCFIEFIGFIKGGIKQKTYFEDGFNEWLEENVGCRISYKDGLVFMLDRDK